MVSRVPAKSCTVHQVRHDAVSGVDPRGQAVLHLQLQVLRLQLCARPQPAGPPGHPHLRQVTYHDLTTDLTTDLCLVLQEGSLTAERGQQAHRDIAREVVDMCQVIWDHALMTDNWDQEDNIACILFQNLFSIYSKISGNVSCKLLYVIYICMKPGYVF